MPSSHTAVTFTLSRDVDGTISGGPSGLSAGDVPLLFRSGIDVLGGTLWFDVRRSEPLPFVEITSAAAAAWWVEGVLGADPATTVAGWAPDHAEAIVDGADLDSAGGADFGADDFPDDPDIALLLAVDEVEEASASFDLDLRRVGASLVALRRLAMGHWLRRYWPAGDRTGFGHLDPLLMDCELATLAWSLDDILLTRQHAGPLLAPHAARLVDLVDDGVGTGQRARLLRAALEVARHTLAPSHPAYAAVCELTAEGEDPGAAVLTFERRQGAPTTVPRSHVALAASTTTGGADGRRVDEVDWQQVPGQVLDWGPDSVEWTLRRDGVLWEVEVTVLAGATPPRPDAPSNLRAVVFTRAATGQPREVGAAALEWAIGGGALVGVVPLGAVTDPPDVDLDVDALVVNVVDASVRTPWPADRATLRRLQQQARELVMARESAEDTFLAERVAFEDGEVE